MRETDTRNTNYDCKITKGLESLKESGINLDDWF